MTRQRIAAIVAITLACGIAGAAILGPLFFGVIRFHMTDAVENQYLGGEIVSFAFVAPLLLLASVLWLRGDRLAPILAFGPAVYAVYTFITVVIGQEYARLPGNVEKAFFLYVALIAGGFALAVLAGRDIFAQPVPMMPDRLRRAAAVVFLSIVCFFALAWTAQILQLYRGERSTEYVDSPVLFWLIKLLDFGFLLPLFAATGVGILKQHPGAIRIGYAMVIYAVCMAGAVLGMAIAMFLRDDPAASTGIILFLTPVLVILVVIAMRMLLLYRGEDQCSQSPIIMDVRHEV